MIAKRDRVLVACSGGADSLALLLLLWDRHKEYGFEVEALHVEHGIRGEESLKDAAFVRDLCLDRNIPYTCVRVDAVSYARDKHLGLEEAARHLRYEALRKRADAIAEIEAMLDGGRNDCASAANRRVKIALAHHAEDNAETILFQMARGSGLDGICGMAPVREENGYVYLRPLLATTREEIEAYLSERGQAFCQDSTNDDMSYSRNYVRKQILPELLALNDQAILHMNQMAEQLTLISDYMAGQVSKTYDRLVRREEKRLQADVGELLTLHPALRREVLLEMMAECCDKRKDLASVHVLALEQLLSKQSGKRLDLPYDMEAIVQYDDLILMKKEAKEELAIEEITLTKEELAGFYEDGLIHELTMENGHISLQIQILTGLDYQEEIQKKAYTKTFDYDKIKKGFCVRKRRENDYFTIKDGHHKTLSTYCIDEKIPAIKRDQLVVLAQGDDIIWLLGGRIGENYKLSEDTKVFVRVNYNGGN